jgi:hypothetical protein
MSVCARKDSSGRLGRLARLSSILGAAVLTSLFLPALAPNNNASTKAAAQAAAQAPATRPRGTVKAINGKTITLTTEAGAEVTVQLQDTTKLVRIAPGETSLKNAAPLDLQDLQVGDRILVLGALAPDGKTVLAASLIAMKQGDIAAKQANDRAEWQRHGVGGLVTKIDETSGTLTVSTNATGSAKEVAVHVTKQTVLRRYALDSVKFDDAKAAPLDQIKIGDQLRARGTRSPDGTELTADEIVSGTFRNIAGTISSVDAAAGTMNVTDLISKKPVIVNIGADSQLRKLPPTMAQVIAVRLRGGSGDAAAGGNPPAGQGSAPGQGGSQNASQGTSANGGAQATPPAPGAQGAGRPGPGGAPGAPNSPGGASGARGGDMQQMLSRLPAVTLADLQKGDAVMIVTTEGTPEKGVTAITLLTGVEPILQAAPAGASSILSPWSLGGGAPGGDASP